MSKATEHATLAEALAAIREELPAFQRTADNPFFNSKYVPLDALIPEIIPRCLAHGVLLTGDCEPTVAGWCYALTATHLASAEVRVCRVPLVGLTDPQKVLAGLTYAQRGAYGILFQLQIGDDTDGNEAAGKSVRSIPEGQSGRQAAPQRRSAPNPAPSGTKFKPQTCPRCKVTGYIRQLKSGKDAGRWRCMDWPEKDMHGCGATYNSDPGKASIEPEPETIPPEPDDLPF